MGGVKNIVVAVLIITIHKIVIDGNSGK